MLIFTMVFPKNSFEFFQRSKCTDPSVKYRGVHVGAKETKILFLHDGNTAVKSSLFF